jgi:molybdopterin molybdotransferase
MCENFSFFILILPASLQDRFKSTKEMITVQEAEAIVLRHCFTPGIITVRLTEAVGRVLAENVYADRDFPPFDRVAMDGIAISFEQYADGTRRFPIQDVQAAGEPVKTLGEPTHCMEVMTGAVLPIGTNTVVRYEDLEIKNSEATVIIDSIIKRQNIHSKGQDAKQKDLLIGRGTLISPAEIALLATVGYGTVQVFNYPRTAIIASGDELIPVSEVPLAHQIRRSNTYAIEASMKMLGWETVQFHFPDDKEILNKELKTILNTFDVIILSGGVSKGKFDYIPDVLKARGIDNKFHQVSQRPGKPFWFGSSAQGKVVFALPGNPVSTFMCFHRFVKPWFLKSLGQSEQPVHAILAKDFKFEPKLTYFLQVMVKNEAGYLMAYPQAGGGSGDFANLKEVNGFLELPLEKTVFKSGEVYPFIPFR